MGPDGIVLRILEASSGAKVKFYQRRPQLVQYGGGKRWFFGAVTVGFVDRVGDRRQRGDICDLGGRR